MSEIKINTLRLEERLLAFDLLSTRLRSADFAVLPSANLLGASRGAMADETNETYKAMCEVVRNFIDLVEATRETLKSVGVDFEALEQKMIEQYERILYMDSFVPQTYYLLLEKMASDR
jgi:uncharacterized UPF0160 family protein